MPLHFDPALTINVDTYKADVIAEETADTGVTVDSLLIKDGGLTAAGVIDANGQKIDLDADADTSITADTDDQIDIEISGADDFQFTANTFTALAGSTIKTNTIAETTGAAGVTIDGVLLKDAAVTTDTINETTPAAGVTVDGVLLKDGTAHAGRASQELTESGAITINSGLVLLNHETVAVEATLDAPAVGDELIITDNSASGTAAHTVTLPGGVTWDGTNDVATFNAPGETLHVIAISATRWLILENIGSVGLS